MQCNACGAEVPADARFCSSCGHELALRADERRVVTVLFADIVGFTGLSEDRDPEQIKNLVDRCFARLADDITSFGGRVDKVIGDAIVALFGAPIAHDDDAERAVRAALRMQDTVGLFDDDSGVGIRLRIGVNTGEVLVGAMQAGDDYTAMGDVVNTASRLQTTAEPGTVVVGTETFTATQELIRYRSVGQLHARGREAPVTAYRAIAPYGRPGERRTSPDLPLVGRTRELETLRSSVVHAFGARRGLLMAITGESGIGKSRVAAEVVDLARFEHDAVVLHGRCLPYGETNVWWPIAELVRSAIDLAEDAPAVEAGERVDAMVHEVLADRAAELDATRVARGVMHLLGYETPLRRLPTERSSAEVTRSTRVLLGTLTRTRSLVLWLSDLHWADDLVRQLVHDLLDRLGRRPVVVLVTGTAALFEQWAPRPGLFNSVSLVLDGLDASAMHLLAAEVAAHLDETTRAALVERAAGNPLFLEEMTRMVSTSGEIEPHALPANVRSVIGARLDVLDERARSVLGDAAVLGLRGSRPALRTMSSYTQGEDDISDAMIALERADLLELTTKQWAFRSNVVRDVVYDRLTKTQRAQRHAGVAEWLASHRVGDADTIAMHFRQAAALVEEVGGVDGAGQDLSAKAIEWTLRTLDTEQAGSSLDQIVELQTAALDLAGAVDEPRAELLLRRAETRLRMLQLDEARADLDAATIIVSDGAPLGLRFRREMVESEFDQWSDDHPAAVGHAQRALALAADAGDDLLRARALRRRGMVEIFQGDNDAAEASISASFDAYERNGDEVGMAWARQNLAWIAFTEGRMAEAEARLLAAADAFQQADDLAGRAWCTGLLAYVRIYAGRFAEADELARSTLLDAREQGDRWAQGMMNVALATSALWTGRIDESLGYAEAAIGHFPDGSDTLGLSQALAARGRALVRRGRLEMGFGLLEQAVEEHPHGPANEMLRIATVAAAATVGDLERLRRVDTGLLESDGPKLGDSERLVTQALALLQHGDPAGAADLLAAAPPVGSPDGSSWAWATLAVANVGLDRPIEALVDAVEVSPRATYSDRVIARLAVALGAARQGDAVAAGVALDRARAALPQGGDVVFPAIIAVADAVVAARLGTTGAAARRTAAMNALVSMGVGESGWWAAFETVVGLESAVA